VERKPERNLVWKRKRSRGKRFDPELLGHSKAKAKATAVEKKCSGGQDDDGAKKTIIQVCERCQECDGGDNTPGDRDKAAAQ